MLVLILAVASLPATVFAEANPNTGWLDRSRLAKGAVGILYEVKKGSLTKVRVKKAAEAYTYTLNPNGGTEAQWFPLQMGDGTYEIAVLEQVTGNKYRVAASGTVQVKVANAPDVYLNAVQNVDWMHADKAVAKAEALTRGSKTDKQKAAAIYQYVVSNIRYDNELAKKVKSEYVPDIDDTMLKGKGICYGYAALFAAMLRSQGIPAKLLMGTTTEVSEYHAWNEIYIDGKWIVVDTTVDAAVKQAGKKTVMEKKAANYEADRIY